MALPRPLLLTPAGMFPRETCVGIGQCNDGSSNVNTSGLVVNFSNDPSSSTGSASDTATASPSSTSASPTGLACVKTTTNSNGGVDINGQGCSIGDITFAGGPETASSAAASVSSSQSSTDGAPTSTTHASLGAALVASLIGACILL